ncbi:MAG: hypothetical protein MUO84_02815, partial [Thermoplasmata archaeon]|nr:hypothetical protein [Thermoplasmata archaeon]
AGPGGGITSLGTSLAQSATHSGRLRSMKSPIRGDWRQMTALLTGAYCAQWISRLLVVGHAGMN